MTASEVEPLPANLPSIQPGSGVCYRIELAWGRWRRWWLGTFRPGYVRRMAHLRRGDPAGAPHAILDPRDLKFCRPRTTAHWAREDDPFTWREQIPLARWGLAEVLLLAGPLVVLGLALATRSWLLAAGPLVVAAWVVSFFRDPRRSVPVGPGLVVAPADGKIVEVTWLDHDPLVGGRAVRIGIFLSIFNVHINRAPAAGRVLRLEYEPGEFLNALRGDSAQRNERLTVVLEAVGQPPRRLVVRQIAGQFARRIVCDLRPGQPLERGEKFGMIKLGSRTELVLPVDEDLEVRATTGCRVRAGVDVLARYRGGETR